MISTILLIAIVIILLSILYVLKKGFNEVISGLNSISKQIKELEKKAE